MTRGFEITDAGHLQDVCLAVAGSPASHPTAAIMETADSEFCPIPFECSREKSVALLKRLARCRRRVLAG